MKGSDPFIDIMERVIGKIPGKTQQAQWKEDLSSKHMALQQTLEVRSKEPMTEETYQSILQSADLKAEETMEGLLEQDIWDEGTKQVVKKKGNISIKSIYGLRDRKNQPMSATSLVRVMNLTLHRYVKRMMAKGAPEHLGGPPATGKTLTNRTGRFANSVQVSNFITNRKELGNGKRQASIYFHFMLAPYQVFTKDKSAKHLKYRKTWDPLEKGGVDLRRAVLLAFKEAVHKDTFLSFDKEAIEGGF